MAKDDCIVPLAGYSDRLSVRPGEAIGFKVSSTGTEPFVAWLTRSISADPNPAGMGIVEEPVEEAFAEQAFPSRYQPFHPGSHAIAEKQAFLRPGDGFLMVATIYPTLARETPQTILGVGDVNLFVSGDGAAAISVGKDVVSAPTGISLRRWYRLEAGFDAGSGRLFIRQRELGTTSPTEVQNSKRCGLTKGEVRQRASIAARMRNGVACEHFNGKIEAPGLYRGTERSDRSAIAQWDFSRDISTTTVRDASANQVDARLVNLPARAVTGSRWDATEMCWRHAPEHYGAIHFHEDDIYDFQWETDFTFRVPEDFPSGVYVMRISCGEHQDAMPFYVCPTRGRPRANLCVLIPTFTYAVYGNHARPDHDPSWQDRDREWNAYPYNPAEYRSYGLSTYNFHSDGSGICHASHRRPLFNLRPGYRTFGGSDCSGLRHFQADSHLISWLHAKGIAYDVITDWELHEEGLACLADYRAVMTTSHPEYQTDRTLDAIRAYRDSGGNLMYLGGNGFYWRIALHETETGAIEIRRTEGGIRAWAAEPGEYYNAFDGAYGGLWRRRGRPPQELVGIGFTAQGEFHGSHYRRKCFDPAYDWIFEGVHGDIIGDFGFSGGGAAGFEMDRVDHRLGSPDNVVVLASSEGHEDRPILVHEEQLTHLTNWPGEPAGSLLRADMVYFDLPSGGCVFAAGSITFCGSLPWNDFSNNVSTILENVVNRMTGAGLPDRSRPSVERSLG